MGCEALVRGADEVVAIDIDRRAAAVAEHNLQATASGLTASPQIRVIKRSITSWLQQAGTIAPFDLIYFDPPYKAKLYDPVLDLLHRQELLASEGRLICEFDCKQVPVIDSRSWRIEDRRDYGKTGLLFLSINRPEHCHGGTGSMQPQKDPEA